MSQAQPPEEELVRRYVAQVDGGGALPADQRLQILDTFENHECWAPYFRLIQRCLKDPTARQLGDYVRLARVQNRYLEDVFAARRPGSRRSRKK